LKILLIGFGSIGKRHYEVLNSFEKVESIDLVTKQDIDNIITYKDLASIKDLNIYDCFVIASETVKHYDQLKYLCSKVDNKKILVEKPLYDKRYEELSYSNKVFTAYNLRFHPVFQELNKLLKDETVYSANIICGQYLPTWRPDQDYRQSYSADLSQGGGVLRDLSHEFDYASWLFGNIIKMDAINTKISDLEINSDDICTVIAVTDRKVIINVSIDYISKHPMRRLIIHTQDLTIEADVIKNSILVYDKESNVQNIELEAVDRNYTYSKMHASIINDTSKGLCGFDEGIKIVDIIENIEFREL